MATTTPRIGLTKPDGTDLVDIAVLNTNFDKIDANIASTKIQATKPTTANSGDLWWDSDTGTLYVYYVGASSSSWVAATSDPINIGVVANQTERDAQYPTPAQGMKVFRQDLGVTQIYYGLYNSSTNVGGRTPAGWYGVEKNVGLIPLRPTSVTPVTGTATIGDLGKVTVSGVTAVILDGIFPTQYKLFKVLFKPTVAANPDSGIRFRMMTNGTEHAAANWFGGGWYATYNGATGTTSVNAETSAFIGWLTSYSPSSTMTSTDISSPNDQYMYTLCSTFSGGNHSTGISTMMTSMIFQEGVAHTGLKIFLNTGTTFSGDILVYAYGE